jgi:hypothetical protein
MSVKPGDFLYVDHWQFFQDQASPIDLPHEFAGFGYGWQTGWFAGFAPLWFIVVASFLCGWFLWRRASRTHPPGHCPKCGYDLRTTSTRCPECGTEYQTKSSPTPPNPAIT